LAVLRNQLKKYVYPVHRLDVATSGVLVFALNKETASDFCRLFSQHEVEKKYFAVVRGHTPPEGQLDRPLRSDSSDELLPATTRVWTHAKLELPFAIGKRHTTARYSLVEAQPLSGRFHQIRRHLAHASHPIIGDSAHGDSHQNRFFKEHLNIHGLLLCARELSFKDPSSGEKILIRAPWSEKWQELFAKLLISPPEPEAKRR
jgi:tRNA pseudouridine65 synthase